MSQNMFDDILDILVFGRAATAVRRHEERLAAITAKPLATDEDVEVLKKALSTMPWTREKSEALTGWCAYRTMSVVQLSKIISEEPFDNCALILAVVAAKGIHDPQNAPLIGDAVSFFDKQRAMRIIFSQGAAC